MGPVSCFEGHVVLDSMHMRMHDVPKACCYPTEAVTAACMRPGDDGKSCLTVLRVSTLQRNSGVESA